MTEAIPPEMRNTDSYLCEQQTEHTLAISEQLRAKAAELMDLIDETIPVLREQVQMARERRGQKPV